MIYTIYNPDTGELLYNLYCVEDDDNLIGKTYLKGYFDPQEFYYSNGELVSKPKKPEHEYLLYWFDWSVKQWQIDVPCSSYSARGIRDQKLIKIDQVNPVRFSNMTDEQKQELATYRQQLLDVPQQAEFPENINWPAQPTWL